MINEKFGKLKVLESAGSNKHNKKLYLCLCDCGNKTIAVSGDLKYGRKKSCGCNIGKNFNKDLTGIKFNYLTVLNFSGVNNLGKRTWNCVCECGKFTTQTTGSLSGNKTKSCGCYNLKALSERIKHGYCRVNNRHPLYSAWNNMIDRCRNKNNKNYKNYGERGIEVCNRWLNSFENFILDMGEKPSPELTIERINNDGNYEPSNCKWATRKEQNMNKRNNKK